MSTPIPLPIWPHGMSTERMEIIKEAKRRMNVPYMVLPSPAVPGSPGRVLGFGSVPDFCTETVLIKPENVNNIESVEAALTFLLQAPPGAEGSIKEEDWLSAVMGCDVTVYYELTPFEVREEREEAEIYGRPIP